MIPSRRQAELLNGTSLFFCFLLRRVSVRTDISGNEMMDSLPRTVADVVLLGTLCHALGVRVKNTPVHLVKL